MKKITKQSKVTLVELPATLSGKLNADLVSDVYSKFQHRIPSRATHYLEAVLRQEGWTDVISLNPLHDGENSRLSAQNFSRIYSSDVLLLSSITRTSPQSRELIKEFKSFNPDCVSIAGGFDPTFQTQKWFEDGNVDFVVLGEGERTLTELMQRLTLYPDVLEDISGLAYKSKGSFIKTEKRPPLTNDELSRLPHPYYSPNLVKNIRTVTLETTRGCPRDCDFCTVTQFHGGRYRMKSIDWVMKALKDVEHIPGDVFITDDNFSASHKNAIYILDEMARRGLNTRTASAQVDVRVAQDEELLKAFRRANVMTFYIGIESINQESLTELGKSFSAEQNKACIKHLRKQGFWVHGMMMLGTDADTLDSLAETSDWVKNNLDSVQYFAQTPLPGSNLRIRLENEGRILPCDDSLYDGQMVLFRPKNFTPLQLQQKIYDMLDDFYSPKNIAKRLFHSTNKVRSIGIGVFLHLMGGRKNMLYNPQVIQHMDYLRSIS